MNGPRANRGYGWPLRATAAAVAAAALLIGLSVTGAVRERNGLPAAANAFLQATIQAGAVTTCLSGASDDVYIPGAPQQLHNRAAVHLALSRLAGCDIAALSRQLDALQLPPSAAVTTARRQQARADIVTGTATLRRVVLDARGARQAMTATLTENANGAPMVLAYRSAAAGSDAAYALALQALALLGQPQSTVMG